MQDAVLRRPGNENTRIPYFLYIDEFSDFVCKATEPMFTLYRKFRVATTISIQSISQLELHGQKENYKSLILSNCASKIFTGNGEWDELEWWAKEFGSHREWTYTNNIDMDKMEYDPKAGGVKWAWVETVRAGKLQNLKQNQAAYTIKQPNGVSKSGVGNFTYLEAK